MIYLNVYELNRHYGGPEEGGWWYDSKEPVVTVKIHDTEEWDSNDFYKDMSDNSMPAWLWRQIDSLRGKLVEVYPEGKSRFSVVPRGTDYGVYVEDEEAADSPVTTPHYE
jgi:hypothetical protein